MKKLFTLLTMLILSVGSMYSGEITTVSTAGSSLTLQQLKNLSGTGGHVAFANLGASPWTNKWLAYPNGQTNLNLSTVQLYTITAGSVSGKYFLQRTSDSQYRTNSGWGDSDQAENIEFRAYSNSSVACNNPISIHNNSGTQWNVNANNFGGMLNAWAAYAAYGPFYIVNVEYVDENGVSIQDALTKIVSDQTTVNTAAPEIAGYRLTSTSTPNTPTVTVSGADVEITYTYEEKWPVNFDKSTRSSHDARYTDKVGLGNQSYSFSAAAGDYIYHDFTNQTFEAPYNTAVTPVIGYRGHAMYGYLYIDYNNDGDFVDDGELVSQLAENSWTYEMRNDDKTIPDFTPSKGGTYRMRYKIDWENTDPGGSSSIASDGGTIIDITLKVYYTIAVNGLIPDGTEITFKENTVTNGSRVYADSPANSDINVTFPSGRDYSYSVSIAGSTITINMLPYVEITDVANLKNGLYVIQGKANGSTGFWYHDKSLSDSRYFRMSTRSSPTLLTYEDNFTSNLKYLWNMTKGESDFTLQNVGTNDFAPADAQRNKNFTGTTTGNFVWDSEHAAIYQTNNTNGGRTLYVHCNALTNQDLNLSYWDNDAPTSLNAGSGSLVAPKFYKVDDRFFMNKYVTQLEAINWGSELSQYWLTGEYAYLTPSINDIISDLKKGYTPERYTQANTLLANYALNMPETGYYRFKGVSHSASASKNYYMSADESTSETVLHYAELADNETKAADAKSIFYYDRTDNSLKSYNTNLKVSGRNTGGTATVITIDANPNDGAISQYRIKSGDNYLVDWGNSETIQTTTDGTDAWIGWYLEKVDELPARTEAGQTAVGNTITFAPAETEVNENVPNVLVETSTPGTYTCNNLQLTDDVIAQFTTKTNFTADTKVTYTRAATGSGWGTIYLPYKPEVEEGVTYYKLTATEENYLKFTKVDNPEANTPYMYKKTTAGDMSVTNEITEIGFSLGGDTDPHEGSGVNNYHLVGILTNSSIVDNDGIAAKDGYNKIIDPNAYYFKNTDNTFRPLPTSNIFSMKAFRCYLTSSTNARQNVLGISYEENDEPTGISIIESEDGNTVDVIFDLNGRRLQNARKGINIINGKKVIK